MIPYSVSLRWLAALHKLVVTYSALLVFDLLPVAKGAAERGSHLFEVAFARMLMGNPLDCCGPRPTPREECHLRRV